MTDRVRLKDWLIFLLKVVFWGYVILFITAQLLFNFKCRFILEWGMKFLGSGYNCVEANGDWYNPRR